MLDKFGAEVGGDNGDYGVGFGDTRELALERATEDLKLRRLGFATGFSHICKHKAACPLWSVRSLYWDKNREIPPDCVERCYMLGKHFADSS